MEDSVKSLVHNLCASLVREYLFRKGLEETLHCMDIELPRLPGSLNNRRQLAKELNIHYFLRKNKERLNPFKTVLEVIIFELVMKNGNVDEVGIQLINSRPTSRKTIKPQWPTLNSVLTIETIQELNLSQPKMSSDFKMSKLFKMNNYKHLFTKKTHHCWSHDGLADLDAFLTSLSAKCN